MKKIEPSSDCVGRLVNEQIPSRPDLLLGGSSCDSGHQQKRNEQKAPVKELHFRPPGAIELDGWGHSSRPGGDGQSQSSYGPTARSITTARAPFCCKLDFWRSVLPDSICVSGR